MILVLMFGPQSPSLTFHQPQCRTHKNLSSRTLHPVGLPNWLPLYPITTSPSGSFQPPPQNLPSISNPLGHKLLTRRTFNIRATHPTTQLSRAVKLIPPPQPTRTTTAVAMPPKKDVKNAKPSVQKVVQDKVNSTSHGKRHEAKTLHA